MTARIITMGIGSGKAISILTNGLIHPQLLRLNRKLMGKVTLKSKLSARIWKAK